MDEAQVEREREAFRTWAAAHSRDEWTPNRIRHMAWLAWLARAQQVIAGVEEKKNG